eukprot:3556346-Rhodomonas_salina.2
MSGTELAYGGIGLRAYYAMSGTELAYGGICLCSFYAMSGTDLASTYAIAMECPVLTKRMALPGSRTPAAKLSEMLQGSTPNPKSRGITYNKPRVLARSVLERRVSAIDFAGTEPAHDAVLGYATHLLCDVRY